MSTDPFAHDDAAYVLGALSPDERAAFETHLATCDECAARVAEVRPLIGLLSGIDANALTLADEPVPDTLLPGMLRAARAEQRRRRGLIATLGGLAAAAVIALAVIVALPGSSTHSGPVQAMTALVSSPVTANAQLTSVGWGTRIDLACRYGNAYASGVAYSLIVVDKSGQVHDAGSWTLTPGKTTDFTGGTSLRRDQIAKIEIAVGTKPILALTV